MTISVKSDLSRHPEGGYAILEGSGLADVAAVSVENCYSGEYLGADGKWGRKSHAFPVEVIAPDALRLGPDIVQCIETDLRVAFRSQSGAELGTVFWENIFVIRDPVHGPSAGTVGDSAGQEAAERVAREVEAEAARLAAAGRLRQAEAERLRQAEAEKARSEIEAPAPTTPVTPPQRLPFEVEPKKRSRAGLVAGLLLLALAIVAGAVIATHPELLHRTSSREAAPSPQPTPTPTPTPTPAPTPPVQPPPPPPPSPPPPARVDCSSFNDRLDGLSSLSDDDKVKLGEEALRASCGTVAFKAFDASDLQTSESAAWNLARFYDPNEAAQVYRDAATADAASAAVYYRLWRDRSARQAAALAKLCAANRGGASLRRFCAR